MKKLLRCDCGSYTLSSNHCPGKKTVSAHPPIFNPRDPHAHYRRMAKGME